MIQCQFQFNRHSYQAMRKRQKQEGTIRKRKSGFLTKNSHPNFIKDITINKINLFREMHELRSKGGDFCHKYQSIIQQLETIIYDLQSKNHFLQHQRIELIKQNNQLRELLEANTNYYPWKKTPEPIIKIKRQVQSEVQHLFHYSSDSQNLRINKENSNPSRMKNVIIGDENAELVMSNFLAEESELIETSIKPRSSLNASHQQTPILGFNQAIFECSSVGFDAPLRVFYLLLLQKNSFDILSQLQATMEDLENDTSCTILSLHSDNKLWTEILLNFIKLLKEGAFQTEEEFVEYLNENMLIDLLFISVLKTRISGILNESEEDLQASTKPYNLSQIDQRKVFLALANQFNLEMQYQQTISEYIFYLDQKEYNENQESIFEKIDSKKFISHQISLEKQPIEEELFFSNLREKQQPIFKLKFDQQKKIFQFCLDIRYEQLDNESFRMLKTQEEDEMSQYFDDVFEDRQQNNKFMYKSAPADKITKILSVREENTEQKKEKSKLYKDSDDYLLEKFESKNISYKNSHLNSKNDQKQNF